MYGVAIHFNVVIQLWSSGGISKPNSLCKLQASRAWYMWAKNLFSSELNSFVIRLVFINKKQSRPPTFWINKQFLFKSVLMRPELRAKVLNNNSDSRNSARNRAFSMWAVVNKMKTGVVIGELWKSAVKRPGGVIIRYLSGRYQIVISVVHSSGVRSCQSLIVVSRRYVIL